MAHRGSGSRRRYLAVASVDAVAGSAGRRTAFGGTRGKGRVAPSTGRSSWRSWLPGFRPARSPGARPSAVLSRGLGPWPSVGGRRLGVVAQDEQGARDLRRRTRRAWSGSVGSARSAATAAGRRRRGRTGCRTSRPATRGAVAGTCVRAGIASTGWTRASVVQRGRRPSGRAGRDRSVPARAGGA